jgi:hypothetical protein
MTQVKNTLGSWKDRLISSVGRSEGKYRAGRDHLLLLSSSRLDFFIDEEGRWR